MTVCLCWCIETGGASTQAHKMSLRCFSCQSTCFAEIAPLKAAPNADIAATPLKSTGAPVQVTVADLIALLVSVSDVGATPVPRKAISHVDWPDPYWINVRTAMKAASSNAMLLGRAKRSQNQDCVCAPNMACSLPQALQAGRKYQFGPVAPSERMPGRCTEHRQAERQPLGPRAVISVWLTRGQGCLPAGGQTHGSYHGLVSQGCSCMV